MAIVQDTIDSHGVSYSWMTLLQQCHRIVDVRLQDQSNIRDTWSAVVAVRILHAHVACIHVCVCCGTDPILWLHHSTQPYWRTPGLMGTIRVTRAAQVKAIVNNVVDW